MNTIAPVWDGNETWLVLGGGGLLAAFPLAYAHDPVGALCADRRHAAGAGLPRRRLRVPLARSRAIAPSGIRLQRRLDRAAFAQGITLGALLQGIAVEGRAYAGGWWDWLTPFSLLVGVSLVCGYALLGATWLIMKSEGTLQARCYRLAFGLLASRTIVAIGAVSAGDAVPERRLLAALVRLAAGPVHRAGAAAGRRRHRGCSSRSLKRATTTRRS